MYCQLTVLPLVFWILTLTFFTVSAQATVVTVNHWFDRGHAMPQLQSAPVFKDDYFNKDTDLHDPSINGDKPITYNGLLTLPDNWHARDVTGVKDWELSKSPGTYWEDPVTMDKSLDGQDVKFANNYEATIHGAYHCAPTSGTMLVDYLHPVGTKNEIKTIRDMAQRMDTNDQNPALRSGDNKLHNMTFNSDIESGLQSWISNNQPLYKDAGLNPATSVISYDNDPTTTTDDAAFWQAYMDHIDKNIPAVIGAEGHARAAYGYDTDTKEFLVYDPWTYTGKNADQRVSLSDVIFMATLQGWYDFGDAPDSYGTLLASDGPRYWSSKREWMGKKPDGSPKLGFDPNVDYEQDGQPTKWANGDDKSVNTSITIADATYDTKTDDDDGVVFAKNSVTVYMNSNRIDACDYYLDGWFDLNRDGDFLDPNEHVIDPSKFTKPAGFNHWEYKQDVAFDPNDYYSRLRFTLGIDANSPLGDFTLRNNHSFGEVEDYPVPEPSTILLVLHGLLGMAIFKRKFIR